MSAIDLWSILLEEEIPPTSTLAQVIHWQAAYMTELKRIIPSLRAFFEEEVRRRQDPADCYGGLATPTEAALLQFAHNLLLRGDPIHVDLFLSDPFGQEMGDSLDQYLQSGISCGNSRCDYFRPPKKGLSWIAMVKVWFESQTQQLLDEVFSV